MGQILCPRLIGRGEQLAALQEALTRARQARGGLVLVVGEAGVGKSRLVRSGADEATDAGMVVLRGRAAPGPAPAPFGPLAEAVLSVVRSAGPPVDADLAHYQRFLGPLVPEWGLPQPAEHSLVLVAEAVLRLLRVLAGDQGLLMVLEDLHWADPETLAILDYLADNLAGEPVTCVVTARPTEDTPGADFVRAVVRRRSAALVELGPLAIEETEQMAAACLDLAEFPPALRDVLVACADGVPFLVEELLAAWVGDGVLVRRAEGWVPTGRSHAVVPVSFAETVQRRVDRLPADAREVLQVAAVLGRRFDWSLLVATLGRDEGRVLDALRRAVDLQLLQVVHDDGGGFRFRHALTRDAILAGLLPPETRAWALRALGALAEEGFDSPARKSLGADLAERAGDRLRAARLLLESARLALRGAALGTAEAALERARIHAAADRDLWLEVLEALVEVHSAAGRLSEALDVGSLVLDVVPASTLRAAGVHLQLARAAVAAEHWQVAQEHLDRTRSVDDVVVRARADGLAALVAIGRRSPSVAEDLAQSALGAATAIGLPDVQCEALQVLGRCARLDDLGRARELFDRAVQVATEHSLPLLRISAWHERATIDLLAANDTTGLEQAREHAAAAGALSLTAVLDVQIAGAVSCTWQTDRLMKVAERATATARMLGLRLVLAMALLWQAAAHAQRGDGERMEALIREALRDAEPDAGALSNGWCRAVLALRQDERDVALAHLEAAEQLLADLDAPNPWGFRGLWCLLHTLGGGDATAAKSRLRSSGATVWWMNLAWLDVCDAVVAGRRGDPGSAAALFRRGDAALSPAPWFRQLTRRLVAETAWEDGWGEPAAWLRVAADHFGRAGHDRLRTGCHTSLRRMGEPVPRRGRGDSEVPVGLREAGVTSREVDVLRLVADGLGNRAIADRLCLSPRTVEKHVASLVAKTGVPDRNRLATYGDGFRDA